MSYSRCDNRNDKPKVRRKNCKRYIGQVVRLLYYLPKEMKVERNRVGNKYTFTPEDKEDEKFLDRVNKKINELEEENKKLKEFKEKRKESRFYFKAQMERAEPKTAREAEDLQKAKELFEKLYREELYYLEEENKKLRDEFMLRLAEAYLLPPTSNQMAEYKKWDYSKWYDEIKNQMRKEIKEED